MLFCVSDSGPCRDERRCSTARAFGAERGRSFGDLSRMVGCFGGIRRVLGRRRRVWHRAAEAIEASGAPYTSHGSALVNNSLLLNGHAQRATNFYAQVSYPSLTFHLLSSEFQFWRRDTPTIDHTVVDPLGCGCHRRTRTGMVMGSYLNFTRTSAGGMSVSFMSLCNNPGCHTRSKAFSMSREAPTTRRPRLSSETVVRNLRQLERDEVSSSLKVS
ncbi:hypothetical protein EVAR_92983_1 [Eumeta japonica]|uniref:Uncharacterized protein n=1 Tax=Eumeta variegata TaxID=151549 RepID=A0A4C1TBE5_EUMVA|nr:hypothetical protein EVAR_92983_1 [Eumeta japonica]